MTIDRRQFDKSLALAAGTLAAPPWMSPWLAAPASPCAALARAAARLPVNRAGIVPHFTGPIATAGHTHTMMAFPGQVLMEFNQHDRPVPYMPEFLECRNGKVWPNDRPGLGISVNEAQLTFIEEMTEAAPGPTCRRPDGSPTHW